MVGFRVIAICGSMRFYQQMIQVAEKLTAQGYIVLMPFVNKAIQTNGMIESMLDQMKFEKINMSDAIFVLNTHGYIGASTRNEILYAHSKGKTVYYAYPALVSMKLVAIKKQQEAELDTDKVKTVVRKIEDVETVILPGVPKGNK